MQKDDVLKILFVINPISGGKEKKDWEEKIRLYFKISPHQIQFYLLSGKNDAVSVKHHLETLKPDRVVAVGGDGTVKMLAEVLLDLPIPLGIIPAGSANGMAKELNIPLVVKEALDAVVEGIVKPVDVIMINNKEVCIHLSDIGMNALLIRYFEKSKKRGMWGYGKGIFRVLWQKQKMYVTIHTDSQTAKRKAYMVVLANARKYGTGANINPEGEIGDGKFEVVVIRKLNVIEILKAILTDKPFERRRIEVFHTRNLSISTLKKAPFQIDGEYRGKVNYIEAKIVPQALRILMPEPAA